MSHTNTGLSYWLVACSASVQPGESIFSILRSRIEKSLVNDILLFDVPLNMRFGGFDDLIRLADDLVKYDSLCEQVVRRIEREILEVDPSAELRIFFQRNIVSLEQYLYRFIWDDARFPRSRLLKENVEFLVSSVRRINEDVHIKSVAFKEAKQLEENHIKSDAIPFHQKDLTDVLTSDIVRDDDFIETEHLTTVVVVVPFGAEKKWLSTYQTLATFVVPESTRNFGIHDHERNSLWRVVLFKKYLEDFRNGCRQNKFYLCDFKYSPTGFKQKLEERNKLREEKDKQQSFMTRVCLASFSDAFIAWIHLKCMRLYVEGVLRYGVPPCFTTFLLKPIPSKEKKLKRELHEICNKTEFLGRTYLQDFDPKSQKNSSENEAIEAILPEEESCDSYILFSFVPFQLFSQK